jgi:hypothetical protein
MTPREKAKELFRKFIAPTQQWDDVDGYITDEYNAKQCALITVNEIINSNPHSNPMNTYGFSTMAYWMEVKQEIEKL